ncbi:choline/ethanolamine transporter flvcr2a isoform X2 [Leptinotarsa decemlineata]|uniref:choline/ethanolamine transporter flvcr2a isoform X2 n=1 Tax=Leptinotarsa decemlineata TaxID=7539 RepID=UPI003D308893
MESSIMKSVEVKLLPEKTEEIHIKAFKRRWFILLVYMYYSCFASLGWIEYSIITNIVVKYYNVSTLAVDWTSIVYMTTFSLLIIPASLIMEKQGLRTTGLIGCIGTFIGIKVFSIRHDLFWIVLLGQIIMSIAQVFIVVLPPKLASVWFKSSEISTACALGLFGGISGNALGYILPTMVVHDSENMKDIASGLKRLCWILTVLMVPVTIVVIFYFPEQPPLPPSATEASRRREQEKLDSIDISHSMKSMLRNKGFLIHMLAFSMNMGVSTAVGTLLNQFILQYFEGATEEAGRMGFLMVIAGMVAILVFGIILDKTRKYKFFYNGYMPVGIELAVELTFPAQEITSTGIIMAGSQVLGALLTVALGHLNLWLGTFWSLAVQAVILFFGTLITAFIPNRMLRQEAIESKNNNGVRKISHSQK